MVMLPLQVVCSDSVQQMVISRFQILEALSGVEMIMFQKFNAFLKP